ncbi:MAG: surfactin synthase thioesterase subunit [Bacteroidia bacterium]|jgi:surfactin synthase thioesterase subunit
MKRTILMAMVCLFFQTTVCQTTTTLYFLPGLGSTNHLFDRMDFDSTFELVDIEYPIPAEGSTMQSYAKLLSNQIDTSQPFVLVGTSIGGMLAVEMADIVSPEKVFIIASVKTRNELPPRYKFQRTVPIHKLVNSTIIKKSTKLLQPVVEPDSKCDRNVFQAMLEAKDPLFMKRAVEMILLWDREAYSDNINHIHGNKDHTLPIRFTKPDYVVEGGSHMMTLTRAGVIQGIIEDVLKD